VNKANIDGYTPIYWASVRGHLEVVQALIAAGADVNKANKTGRTPISQASYNGRLEVVQALIAAGAAPPA
jgi:ankyrin repeat protein